MNTRPTAAMGQQRRFECVLGTSAIHQTPDVYCAAKRRGRSNFGRAGVAYSITSSATARSDGGTSRPSAFAVLRLMTKSNLVG
jgi:hypothetical protein